MRLQLHGRVDGPVVAVLGTWDPFLPSHERLVARLLAHARAHALVPVAVLLDPAPALFINGAHQWPVYHDVATRLRYLQATGIAVAHISFVAADLGGGAADFFAVLRQQVTIAEFWLRDGQTIGFGPRGNATAVYVDCLRHKARLHQLPADDTGPLSSSARQHLAAGAVALAGASLGRAPIVSRPVSQRATVAWRAGRYLAQPLASPLDAPSTAAAVTIRLTKRDDGMSHFAWPDSGAEYLTFLAGPGDDRQARGEVDHLRTHRRHRAPAAREEVVELAP